MKQRDIPVHLVDTPEVRVTAVYDEEQLQLLRDSLRVMGTVQPIIVFQSGQRYQVVDGLHRLEEARRLGSPTIPAVVYEGDAADALLHNLVLNRLRGKTRASEMVAVIEALWNDHHLDSDAIAERTGLTRDYVERLQRISRAAPSVREALDRELIGVGLAHEISRLPSPVQQDQMLAQAQTFHMSVKEAHGFVNDVLREMEGLPSAVPPGQEAEPPPPPVYTCAGCKQEVEPRYLASVTLCPHCFGKVYTLAQAPQAAAPASPADGASP